MSTAIKRSAILTAAIVSLFGLQLGTAFAMPTDPDGSVGASRLAASIRVDTFTGAAIDKPILIRVAPTCSGGNCGKGKAKQRHG
jgi:hypothetical protein